MEGVFNLCLDHKPFLTLSNPSTRSDGSTGGRFRKEVIKKGQYVQKVDGLQFEITDDTLAHWVAQFAAMRKNGVKVPVPMGHDESAESNRGWVEDLFVDGDALVMVCELFDKDVANLVKRNDVSVYSPPTWVDGKGNKYLRPIRHIALTPTPVIPELDEFRPIAASFERKKSMPMDLKKLGADIGIGDELTEDTAAALILDHCTKMKDAVATADKTAKSAEAKAKAAEAAKGKPLPEIDSTLLSLAHDNRTMKLDALVAAGKITPAVKDKLVEAFIGDDSAALKLSLQTKTADVFDDVVKSLAENDPVKLKEQTGPQGKLKLSDPNKGVDENILVKDAEARGKAVAGQPGYKTSW